MSQPNNDLPENKLRPENELPSNEQAENSESLDEPTESTSNLNGEKPDEKPVEALTDTESTEPSETVESAQTTEQPPAALSPRDFRVSEQERQHVAGVLHKALERGLLNPADFTARTEKALAAHTRAELNEVLANLPGLIHRDRAAVA